jgi:hypothetical protein
LTRVEHPTEQERQMKSMTHSCAFAAALLLLCGSASGQTGQITPDQERAIFGALIKQKPAKPPPASFNASVGMDLPAGVEVYDVPPDGALEPVRRYRYTVMGDQVVLVDPETKKVVLVFIAHD